MPIQTKLVDKDLLSLDELNWLNDYNRRCFESISPLMKPEEPALKWLLRETMAI
jgi:Xaa-Pro aminopeptidase